ncbi:hypothetical protein Pst134EA_027943 [Puccinia striiformis f. sp. tritici]|nr:hypothetical protein Pst134EA_027943 [Puccinia striiformis f. sp. tritici]KAH9448643.1 hypothetical protein Pst134EA_027943 [Puccinia striiformis f. sp. tritici]
MSVIQSLAAGPPFGKPEDVEMGVSYASFFIMVYNIMMFVGPGTRMIDQDFIESEGDTITTPYIPYDPTSNRVEQASIDDQPPHADNEAHPTIRDNSPEHDMIAGQQFSRIDTQEQRVGFLARLIDGLSPVIVSLIIGTIVAVTPLLKGMFTVPSNSEVQKPTTPDGKPLLSVILDSTDYLGAAAIPLGLLVTGASFANMSIPRNSWHRLPLRAILGLTIIKLVCLPIIGIIAVSLIDRYTILFVGHEGKVLKLICLYYSCTVTSTNQISLSSIAAGLFFKHRHDSSHEVASNVDLLCSFVALQYLIYPFVATFFIGVIIKMVS